MACSMLLARSTYIGPAGKMAVATQLEDIMTTHRCAVVGSGIIEDAVAREIMTRFSGANITIFEKEAKLAGHQTGHNFPGSVQLLACTTSREAREAQLCSRGGALLKEFCAEKGVASEECGKIVVAQDSLELARLKDIFERALANGVPGVRMLNEGQMRRSSRPLLARPLFIRRIPPSLTTSASPRRLPPTSRLRAGARVMQPESDRAGADESQVSRCPHRP